VLGLEVVVPPGELASVGGAVRKDVSGYDLKSLLIGSEGTLGVITAAWLRLLPAPEGSLPVAAFYEGAAAGCEAIGRVYGSGILAAALEFLDGGALAAAGPSFPGGLPAAAGFLVLAVCLGGSISGEHGVGRTKHGQLALQLGPRALELHAEIKRAFDPKGLLNPGKKL
jgi:FAD/FMN-containing dehydrogenase